MIAFRIGRCVGGEAARRTVLRHLSFALLWFRGVESGPAVLCDSGKNTGPETIVVNLFFWKRPPQPNTQGYRTQLESLTRELRLRLGDVPDASLNSDLLRDLSALESLYLGDLRELQRSAK